MPFTQESLAHWLEGAGSTPANDAQTLRRRVEQLYKDALDRDPGESAVEQILAEMASGSTFEDVRCMVYASIERFSQAGRVGDSASHAFRRLSVLGDDTGAPVAPQIIGECIASYRLILGRDPDDDGFRTFVLTRRDRSLVDVVSDICGSPEAIDHNAPHAPPSPPDAARAATLLAVQFLHALTADVSLARLERLERLVESIERNVKNLSEYVMLRLDAQVS